MIAPEPQAMTLEEGLAALFPDTIGRRDDGKWPFFTYMNNEHGHTCTAIFDTWPEAVSWAKGVPVVARDEAAELRAENERLRADLFWYVLDAFVQGTHRQEDGGYHTGGISTYRDLGDWLVEHAHWTHRPGGRGRNQVYDPPKADAASEGQP